MVPRWASDITVLRLNTGITAITVYRGKPNIQTRLYNKYFYKFSLFLYFLYFIKLLVFFIFILKGLGSANVTSHLEMQLHPAMSLFQNMDPNTHTHRYTPRHCQGERDRPR